MTAGGFMLSIVAGQHGSESADAYDPALELVAPFSIGPSGLRAHLAFHVALSPLQFRVLFLLPFAHRRVLVPFQIELIVGVSLRPSVPAKVRYLSTDAFKAATRLKVIVDVPDAPDDFIRAFGQQERLAKHRVFPSELKRVHAVEARRIGVRL